MLPLIELEGTPYEQGNTHGRRARERIEHNLRVYFERFQSEGKVGREEVLRRASAYWGALQDQNRDYAHALRGLAQGSGCDLIELVALNVRYEILYHQFAHNSLGQTDGCTTFAVLPQLAASGHLLMGQNWDWIPQVQGVVLHERQRELEILTFTEAGIVGGKLGLNSWGLGLAINGLTSEEDDWSRLQAPFHVRCYELLRARDLGQAMQIVTRAPRPCSANFLVAQVDDQVVDIEAAPLATRTLLPENGFTAHTNHFLDPEALGITEPRTEKWPHSCRRLRRMAERLASKGPLALQDLACCLRDHDGHPHSICRHIDTTEPPSEHYRTVTSAVMDLHERVMWISDGPPCENDYQQLCLEH